MTKEKLKRNRILLVRKKLFFGYLALHLRLVERPEVETAAVDFKGNMYYNPEFINKISDEELQFTIAHEVMHLALGHDFREGNRNTVVVTPSGKPVKLWNIAADLVINTILADAGFKVPQNVLAHSEEERNQVRGKTTEQVYDELLKKMKQNKQVIQVMATKLTDNHEFSNKMKGSGKGQSKGMGKSISASELRKWQQKWKSKVAEAATRAKQQGQLPAGIERIVDMILGPSKLNWKQQLLKFIQEFIPHDYTYLKPSKQSLTTGIYLPSTRKEQLEVVVGVDTSGSISNQELKEFLREVIAIAKSYDQVKMWVIPCDAEVQDVYPVQNGGIQQIAKIKMKGGGGTDFRPVFKYIDENIRNCKILIYLTDGYGDFPGQPPRYHTIWVVSKDGLESERFPFGTVLRL